jgi:hypothetical protein
MALVASRLPTRRSANPDASFVAAWITRVAVVFATAIVGVAAVGAVAVRPIADDFVVNAKLTQAHGALPAFGSWMTSWTAYYSEYGILTGLAGLTRALGIDRYTFAIASVAFLVLLVASIRACVNASRRLGFTSWGWPETALLAAGLFGAFAGPLKESLHTNLYEAIYWASAWMSHLVPVVACPLVIIAVLRIRNLRMRTASAFFGGLFIAGFGFAETVIVTAIVGACAWVAYRLRNRHALASNSRTLVGAGLGLLAGSILVARLPGTIARTRYFGSIHLGLSAHPGLANLTRAAAHIGWLDAKAVVLSPAPVLGIFIGLALCLAPLSRTRAELTDALPVLVPTAWVVVLASWAAVTFGDLSATLASWHLLPLVTVLYAACVLTGYALGTRSEARYLPVGVCVCLVAALAWTTAQTTSAANVVLVRSRVFDQNVRAAHTALGEHPPRPVVWRSMSIGSMTDAAKSGPNAFAGVAVAQWLDIPPDDLVIVPVSPPETRFP